MIENLDTQICAAGRKLETSRVVVEQLVCLCQEKSSKLKLEAKSKR